MRAMVLPAQLALFPSAAPAAEATLVAGDRLELLRSLPDGAARLVVTSPPYNVGKEYESALPVAEYVAQQETTLAESVRVLA